MWKVLREFVDTNALEHCATTVCRFRALLVEQWRDGRILLTGDAAHEMPTFLGQGLCAGLRDAFNLAWKLDAVLRGRSGTSLLDTYCEERKFHVRRVIGHAITSGLVVGELDVHAARERAGRLGEDSRSQGTATTLQHLVPSLQVGLIARDDHGRPLSGAGELLVQPWVRVPGGPWRRLDDVLGANVAIVARSARTLRSLDEALLADWRHLDGSIAVVRPRGSIPSGSFEGVLQLEEREALLSSWLAGRRGVALVARPDRYVYGVARSDRELRAHVSRLSAAIRAR